MAWNSLGGRGFAKSEFMVLIATPWCCEAWMRYLLRDSGFRNAKWRAEKARSWWRRKG